MKALMRVTESLPRNRWTLERFGLSPGKAARRLLNPGAPRVFCVSIPKAGTHLLERAICLHPMMYRKLLPTVSHGNISRWGGLEGLLARMRPGQVIVSHLRFLSEYPPILERRGVKGIFLIRDPHDIVVSQIHYVSKRADHRLHELFTERTDAGERLKLAIEGDADNELPSIGERLDLFAGWLDSGFLVIRFEDLIGVSGGGSDQSQRRAVAQIYRFIGLDVNDRTVRSVCERLFSRDSPTFRKGTIGGWRSFFDPELEAIFDRVVQDRAHAYGYSSESWS